MTNTDHKSTLPVGNVGREASRRAAGAMSSLKTMLLGGCLAVSAASPSSAQSYDPSIGSGNIAVNYAQTAQPRVMSGAGAGYARTVSRLGPGVRKLYARFGTNAYAFDGRAYVDPGSPGITDPDPNIRFQLNRESLQGRW